MFGEQPTSKSLPPPARRTSNQASPVPERSHDNSSTIKPPTAENLSASTGSITQDSLASPLPATVTTSDIVDYGRSRTRAHKRSRSLEKSANLSTKALDTVNTQAPKCTYVRMHVCMYVCMYVCVLSHFSLSVNNSSNMNIFGVNNSFKATKS